MSKFTDKRENLDEQKDEEFTSMLLPFLEKKEEIIEEKPEHKAKKEAHALKNDATTAKPISKVAQEIDMIFAGVSPIDALKEKMKANIPQVEAEQPKAPEAIQTEKTTEKLVPEEPKAKAKEDKIDDAYIDVVRSIEEKMPKTPASGKPVKRGSLLAKCLPYIYDEDGIKYEDEKPNYTLESVEDIIDSAEKKAEKKLAKLYGVKTDSKKLHVASATSAKLKARRYKIGEQSTDKQDENRRLKGSAPTKATTLLDDFSGKRTVIETGADTAEVPVKLTKIQTDIPLVEDKTRVIPALKPENDKKEIFEDILSHTKPINIRNLPGVTPKPKKPSIFSFNSINEEDIEVDDYRSADDIKRIGAKFKKARRAAFSRLAVTVLLSLISVLFATPLTEGIYAASPLAASVICLTVGALLLAVNFNLFKSFAKAFSPRMGIELPICLGGIANLIYLICSLALKVHEPEHSALFAVSLLVYNFCSYKKTSAQLEGFKAVAARGEKKAITLIDDQNITAHMSKTAIEGEVLAIGSRRTNEITDYVKHTSLDLSFKGRLPVITVVMLIISVIISLIIGMSYGNFFDAVRSLAVLLSLSAMPTIALADMLPFFRSAERLRRKGAVLCSGVSAEKIEEGNAVVVSSFEIFGEGAIKLYDMKPLSANNIDKTIMEAAAVAAAAKSPLLWAIKSALGRDIPLPSADTVQYEDNLGISGWVEDRHLHIGNRTLMESHGIRVPSLEVDKKILHRGYFPVYIASEQRACALLIIKYEADDEISGELIELQNAGFVLLVDNCDPNITEEMLSDYCGLYKDSIKIMDHHGVSKYKSAVNFTETASAEGFYKGGVLSYLSCITGAIRLKRASAVLQVLHIICSVIGCLVFAYLSLNGGLSVMAAASCLLLELAGIIIALTGYMITKP